MSKASKFQMVDPVAGDVAQQVAADVEERMTKAMEDLRVKHRDDPGGAREETSVDAPTGEAYKQAQAQQQKADRERRKAQREAEEALKQKYSVEPEETEERILEGITGDEDAELRNLREQRLRQLRDRQKEKADNLSRGHGQYREITQDEFLPEVTGSKRVLCHFFHSDFPRCAIMHHHLQLVARQHIETKVVSIDANKAPFFVQKLAVRALPTVVCFVDGISKQRIVGFEGLTEGLADGKEDEWTTDRLIRLLGNMGMIDIQNIEGDAALTPAQRLEEMRMAMMKNLDDEDFDLDGDGDDYDGL